MADIDLLLAKLQELDDKISGIQLTPPEPPPEIINAAELAKRLQISAPTLRRLRETKKIPSLKIGADYRFNYPKVIEALQKSK